jgi:hypothetical protein
MFSTPMTLDDKRFDSIQTEHNRNYKGQLTTYIWFRLLADKNLQLSKTTDYCILSHFIGLLLIHLAHSLDNELIPTSQHI